MKKLASILAVLLLIVSLFSACDPKPQSEASITEGKTYKIGLIQLVEHPSLDEIRTAFTAEVEASAAAKGMTVAIDYKNAQNDMSLISSICRNFVEDQVDVIVAITTPAAQGAANATTEIPIVFSAVSDPVAAGLLTDITAPAGNITGVSDAIDVEKIFALSEELTPGIQTFGFLYNKGEINSVSVTDAAKAYLDGKGIAYVEKTVANSGEVQQAARVLMESCDAVFVPIDNTVASAMGTVAEEAKAAKKPVYVAADSLVADGGLATVGVNYTDLGKKTAEMTLSVLEGKPVAEIPVEVMGDGRAVVNEETAAVLGIDVSKYVK